MTRSRQAEDRYERQLATAAQRQRREQREKRLAEASRYDREVNAAIVDNLGTLEGVAEWLSELLDADLLPDDEDFASDLHSQAEYALATLERCINRGAKR